MEINVRGDKIKVTQSIKDYIQEKIGRLDKYFDDPSTTASVIIRVKGINQIIEVTIPLKKIILRGEETHSDLYAAIDLVTEKIERQIRKNKTKIHKQSKESYGMILDFEEPEEDESKIVKRKKLDTKPMSEEEAILQMEMLGHSFFIYEDDELNEICVLYRRKDGNYGVIETK